MRPRNQVARDQLLPLLGRMPRASAGELATALQVSIPTIHRLLAELPAGRVVSAGRTRRTRYALRRPLRGDLSDIPLYAIDSSGKASLVSRLALIHPQGTLLALGDLGGRSLRSPVMAGGTVFRIQFTTSAPKVIWDVTSRVRNTNDSACRKTRTNGATMTSSSC